MRAIVGSMKAPAMGGRHSRRVDRLRFFLPAIALLLLAVVMAWPWLTGGYGGLIVPVLKHASDHANDLMRMSNPRYVGSTKTDEAFEVTASSAFLDPADPDRIQLDQLDATLEQAGTSTFRVRADEGTYLRKQDILELEGDLEVTFGPGYRFQTESAEVDLERGHVVGTEPIIGDGPVGTLAAEQFDIKDGGKRLRFEGRVQVTIFPVEPAT